jgi:type VI secretion system secreted protein VgrG
MPLTDRFLFEIKGVSDALRVVRFTGHEGLSELFRFDLVLACENPAVDLASAIGQPALLTMQRGGDPRYLHGMIARCVEGEAGTKLTSYHVTVVPKPWLLLHRFDCRIFQELTAPQIIQKVLEGAGLASGDDFRLSLQATYATREYCVQYRESDLAFVSRLMEEEGIYYFFEHHEDKHVLVLGDKTAAHPSIEGEATVRFHPLMGAMVQDEQVSRFERAQTIRSGKVTVRDYDFAKPSLLLEGTAAGATFADLEVYDHPGDFAVPADGATRSQIRLEERTAARQTAEGESGCDRFFAGATFTLGDHQREALNCEWTITRVEHQGSEPSMGDAGGSAESRYQNRFECIPAEVPFRPPLATPRPTIKGVQSAIVVGPSGEEIYTDEHGRVKVQFPWDRLGKSDDKSSCWIRVSQVWAGEGWGAMHIPRIKQEVLVDFLDGDPDRPIIVGRVYHGTNVPPYALPANKTRSTIKSNSTPGGGGSNELRFEDKKGSEEIYLHGQKDWTIGIENDKNQTVGNDETLSVTHDRSAKVGNDQSEEIGHDEKFSVGNDRTRSVGHDESVSVTHDRTIQVGNDHTEAIGGNMSLSVSKDKSEDVTGDSSETVGKSRALSAGKDYAIDVTGNMTLKVGSSSSENVELEKTVTVGSKISIVCGDAKVTIEKNGNVTVEGANISVKSSGDVKVESSGKVEVKSSGDVKVEASGKVEVKGSGPMDLNASGPVKVKGSNVGIN